MSKKNCHWSLTVLVTVLALVCTFAPGYADVVTFDSSNDTTNNALWGDPLNWDTDMVPGPSDDAVVPQRNPGDRVAVESIQTVNSLQIGGGGDEQVRVMNGGDLIVNGDVLLGIVEDGANSGGQIRTHQSSAFLTIFGNIVANSPDGANDVVIRDGVFRLDGDIIMTGENRIDILNIHQGEFLLGGAGAQTLTVEQFDLAVAGGPRDATFDLAVDKTLITTNAGDNNEIGRNTDSNDLDDPEFNNGTFNIPGGTATFAGSLRVGSVSNGGTNSFGEGHVNVSGGGTLTVNNGLQVGIGNNDNKNTIDPTSFGDITVDGATSTVTVSGGIRLAENDARTTATITINDGLFQLTSGDITTGTDEGTGISTINLNGGTLDLAATDSVSRVVTQYSQASGTTLKLAMVPGMATFEATTMTLASGSVIDLDTSPTASTTTLVTWDGGESAWDADATKWNPDVLPADGTSIMQNDQFTILQAGSLSNSASLDPSDTADWSLQTSGNTVKVTRTGADLPLGPAVAVIDNSASIVSRDADLNIQAAAGVGADASRLDISDGSLTLTGTNNLLLGAGPGQGDVNQSGGAVTVGGVLQIGAAAGDGGGVYVLSGGALDVQGNVGGESIVLADPDATATLIVDGGTLNTAGGVEVNLLIVGNENDAALTITDTAFTARRGNQLIGNAAGVTATVDIGGSASVKIGDQASGEEAELRIGAVGDNTTNATVTLSGTATVEVYGNNTEVGVDGNGTLDIQGGTWTQLTNNLVVSQNHATNATGTMTMSGGVYDLRPSHTANPGQGYLNFNDSDKIGGTPSTVTITGGTMYVGGHIQMTDRPDASGVLTIDGGDVHVGENVEYRANTENGTDTGGTDTINLKSGNLVFSDAAEVVNAVNADSADPLRTNTFNWTGGSISGLEEFNGLDLVQKSTDSASLLQIGSSAGTMTIGQSYLLDAGDNTLEIELFAQGTTAGTDFDLLTITGNATLAGIVDVLDASGGAIDPNAEFEWNVVEADEITLTGMVNVPAGFDFRVVDDLDGGLTDVLQIFLIGVNTTPGDYNNSGLVEQGDLDLVLLNWGKSGPPAIDEWVNDQPTDGTIDQNDLDGVLLNWGNSSASASAAVPEPTTGLMLILGMAVVLVRRKVVAS